MSNKISYFNQFDTLRALAVIMTVIVHYAPDGYKISYMDFGVDLFFAISGFLITSILLKSREESQTVSKIRLIKNFMIRRALRLFPVYYLLLLCFILLSKLSSDFSIFDKGNIIYYLTYTANFLFFEKGFQSGLLNHIWSLCVEEQFYILWPWLILFLPFRWIKSSLFLIIILGYVSWILFYDTNEMMIDMLPISNFYLLGIGALLSYLWYYRRNQKFMVHCEKFSKIYFVVAIILIVFYLSQVNKNIFSGSNVVYYHIIRELLYTVVLFFLLLSTIIGWRGGIGILANNEKVQYFGKISYGIYIYHKPFPILLAKYFGKNGVTLPEFVIIILSVLLTILTASMSYKYIETPFLGLKKKFNN